MYYAAVELFVNCAQAAQPSFALTDHNARAVQLFAAGLFGH
jgi:predicted ATPase